MKSYKKRLISKTILCQKPAAHFDRSAYFCIMARAVSVLQLEVYVNN